MQDNVPILKSFIISADSFSKSNIYRFQGLALGDHFSDYYAMYIHFFEYRGLVFLLPESYGFFFLALFALLPEPFCLGHAISW